MKAYVNWRRLAAFGFLTLACLGGWAAVQIQITDIGLSPDGHLKIVREGTDPICIWVRYPGEAEWIEAGTGITTETWISPLPGEVAQFKVLSCDASESGLPPDDGVNDDSTSDNTDTTLFPGTDDSETSAEFLSSDDMFGESLSGDITLDGNDFFSDASFIASDTPKNNQASATPDAGTTTIYWLHNNDGRVASWIISTSGVRKASSLADATAPSGWTVVGTGNI